MQKIRFFAALLFTLALAQIFPATATVSTESAAQVPTVAIQENIPLLPTAKSDLSKITKVIPGGDAVAVRLMSKGVIVLGFTDEDKDNPARSAGLKRGDRILSVGEWDIEGNQSLAGALEKNGGNPVTLRYCRGNKEYETKATPRKNQDGTWQLGILVKDSTAGIGTLTYVVPDSGEYGCLGHGISDPDTDTLFCVGKGNLYPAQITNLRKGQ
jgi:stage IV sporulation protein B